MLRFLLVGLLIIIIARTFWTVVDGIMEGAGGATGKRRTGRAAVKLARDPVCGTFVAPATALSLSAGGTTHYFCSEDCRRKFRR